MMGVLNDSLIVKFILVFLGLYIWGVVSFYLVKEATLYIHEALYNSKPDIKDIIVNWVGMNVVSLAIAIYWNGVC